MPFEDFLNINTPEPPPGPRNDCSGRRNTLISALRKSHSTHVHVLSASVKFAIMGEIEVETTRGIHRLNNKRFLVLNAWEPYTFKIAPGSLARTLSLFFRPRYLSSLQEVAVKNDAALLERGPGQQLSAHLDFPEAVIPSTSSNVGPRLLALFNAWQRGASQHCLSDRVRDVGEALIDLRSGLFSRLNKIDAVKRSTREELFRRAQLADVFIRENYSEEVDLNVVARQVCMAPHHLHRTFRAIHGFTLHERIVQLRIGEARRLLQETDIAIGEVCNRVGYSSLPSFTTLFKSRLGQPPSAFRRTSRVGWR